MNSTLDVHSSASKLSPEFSAENALFELGSSSVSASPLFILGAPRTGSTFLYQMIVRVFGLPFISNVTNNYFPRTPIIGLALQRGVNIFIDDRNTFGKTEGPFQPSEGSGPLTHWFGGGHPSQNVSSTIVPGREEHFLATLAACEAIYGGLPLVFKNPWNCFRVTYLATRLPSARFIWLKKDIRDSAESDLEARLVTKDGDLHAWNSATPSNVDMLKMLAPEYQVVENQFEFNRAINDGLLKHASGRWIEIWYEDFVSNPASELERISHFIGRPLIGEVPAGREYQKRSRQVTARQSLAIRDYVHLHSERLGDYCYV